MAFGNGADNNIEIKVVVDAEGSIKVLNSLGDEVANVEKVTQKAEGGFSKFQAGILTLNSALDLASKGFNALNSIGGAAFDAISRGSDIQDVEDAFARLTDKAGTLSDTFLTQLQESTGGTITNFDLMRQANEKLQAGLKPDQIIAMSDAARVFADESGESFNSILQEIEGSVLRGNDRFLKSKGIILDANTVYADFAKTLGIGVEQLNDVGKAEALRAATLDKLTQKVAESGKVQQDVGDKVASISVILRNAYDDVAKTLSKDEGVIKFVNDFANSLKIVLPAAVKKSVGALTDLRDALTGQNKAFNTGIDIIKNTAKNYLSGLSVFQSYNQAVDQSVAKIGLEYLGQLQSNQGKKEAAKVTEALTVETKSAVKAVIDSKDKTKDYINVLQDSTEKKAKDKTEWEKLSEVAKKHGIVLSDVNGEIIELGRNAKSTTDDVDRLFAPDNLAGSGKPGFDAGQSIGAAILSGLQGALGDFASGNFGKNSVGQFGSAIGTALGSEAGKALGEEVGGLFGDALGPLGAAFGGIAGDKLGQGLFSAVSHIFGGGRDPGNKARKAADKFFADLFDPGQLSVVIDGQLQRIKDLTFGEGSFFASGEFSNAFNELSDAARTGFQGVGAAFEQLLGTGEEVAGQLAAVFTNNLGGSLNNLQLLVQASGKSFQDLEGYVVTAFEQGKLSALEAQVALSGIQKVAEKGIPDAIGAVNIAFENLESAGVKGGLASKDALQDLASEAKELGKKTLPELQAALLESAGADQEAINKLFGALGTYGVTTLDQLENLSSQTAIAILANLQSQNFPFAEQIEKLDEIKSKIDEIPDNIKRNLTFDVKINASSEDRSLLNRSQISLPSGPGLG